MDDGEQAMSDHYGEQIRPWPTGSYWDDDEVEQTYDRGYYMDYRSLFDGWVENVVDEQSRLHVFVHDRIATLGAWQWQVGTFSWTPDGDLYDTRITGLAPNRVRAVAQAHEAALSRCRLDIAWHDQYEERERAAGRR